MSVATVLVQTRRSRSDAASAACFPSGYRTRYRVQDASVAVYFDSAYQSSSIVAFASAVCGDCGYRDA